MVDSEGNGGGSSPTPGLGSKGNVQAPPAPGVEVARVMCHLTAAP